MQGGRWGAGRPPGRAAAARAGQQSAASGSSLAAGQGAGSRHARGEPGPALPGPMLSTTAGLESEGLAYAPNPRRSSLDAGFQACERPAVYLPHWSGAPHNALPHTPYANP